MSLGLIAIAGGTGSGKSTLADALSHALDAVILPIDDYYRPLNHLTFEERERVNFDSPEAIDHVLLIDQLTHLIQGRTIEKPVYDFSKHTRSVFGEKVSPRPIVIVEGLFALYWPALNGLCSAKIFVETDAGVRFERRLKRDIEERGRDEKEVTLRFQNHVEPMHERFVAPTRDVADYVIRGDRPMQEAVQEILGIFSNPRAELI